MNPTYNIPYSAPDPPASSVSILAVAMESHDPAFCPLLGCRLVERIEEEVRGTKGGHKGKLYRWRQKQCVRCGRVDRKSITYLPPHEHLNRRATDGELNSSGDDL